MLSASGSSSSTARSPAAVAPSKPSGAALGFQVLAAVTASMTGSKREHRQPGGNGEPPPRVPDEPAAERHRGPPAGDEPADDDEPHAVAGQRPFRPVAAGRALAAGEEPPGRPRPEPPADQVGQIVAGERARGRAGHDEVDPRVGGTGRGHPERDDHGLARQHGQHRVQTRQAKRDQVGERRAHLQAGDAAHPSPRSRRSCSIAQ